MKQILCYEAGYYQCSNCGADNFVKIIPHVMKPDELEAWLRESGRIGPSEEVPPTARVVFRSFPTYVQCCACRATFNPILVEREVIEEFEEGENPQDF